MQQRLEQIFEVDANRFWETFLLDEEYERALYDHLALKLEHKQLDRQGSGDELVLQRELHLTPDRNIPTVLAKLLRGATLVKERASFDARKKTLDIEVVLPVIGSLVSFTARYTWEDLGPSRFKRVWNAECRARLPLVGKQLERYLLGETESSMARGYAFTCDWLAANA